jgi:hypothetical protein
MVLFNRIPHGEDPPEDWQKATVIPLFKKGTISNCDDYGGVCLLNSWYKIYDTVVFVRADLVQMDIFP